MNRYIAAAAFIVFSCLPHFVKAEAQISLKKSGYVVYEADVNTDGCLDYLVKSRSRVVFLSDEFMDIPVQIPSAAKPFILMSGADCKYSIVPSPSQAQLSYKYWVLSGYKVIENNSRGDIYGSLLVYSSSDAGYVFNIARGENPINFSLLQILDSSDLGLSDEAILNSVSANADDRSDLLVMQHGGVRDIYVADARGMYFSSGAYAAIETWNLFVKNLRLLDAEGAAALVSEKMRVDVLAELSSPEADFVAFCSSIVRFEVLEEDLPYVRAVVVLSSANLGDIAHYVIFSKDPDGVWRINSL